MEGSQRWKEIDGKVVRLDGAAGDFGVGGVAVLTGVIQVRRISCHVLLVGT